MLHLMSLPKAPKYAIMFRLLNTDMVATKQARKLWFHQRCTGNIEPQHDENTVPVIFQP